MQFDSQFESGDFEPPESNLLGNSFGTNNYKVDDDEDPFSFKDDA